MSLQRTLIVVASAVALTILSACQEKQANQKQANIERSVAASEKPIAVYVQPGLTLDSYAEPGQKLEWRVDNAHSPTFTFTPQPGLCDPATIEPKARFHHPAGCVVAPQTYPPGALFNTYQYTLQSDSPPAPGAPAPASTTYSQRVGSCGPCR